MSGIDARVKAMSTSLDLSKMNVGISCERPSGTSFVACSSPSWQAGDAVVVKVDYAYSMIWPLAMGKILDLSSTVQMRIE